MKPIIAILIILIVTGCATTTSFNKYGNTITGIASWYGGKFIGRKTANGEIFTSQSLTAANKTLPFNTRVLVTNLNNGKSVVVRINDRGPYVGDRIIDLSYAAAKAIDMIGTGTAPVRLEIIKPGEGIGTQENRFTPGSYYLQLGLFSVKENAERMRNELYRSFNNIIVDTDIIGGKTYYRVLVGPFEDQIATYIEAEKLKDMGYVVIVNKK
ncbi:MAG: septal ring lytic transglycosylase RlpA family protein [bacterium]